MLDEYILNQLEQVDAEYQKLNHILEDLNEQESKTQASISTLLNSDDIGMEIFSPRASANSAKAEIGELQKHLEELRIQQVQTSEDISKNREKYEKYKNLLEEARMKDIHEAQEQKDLLSDNLYKEDLREILNRVETCLNLVNHDRRGCKNELKNLRYYLKALLGSE